MKKLCGIIALLFVLLVGCGSNDQSEPTDLTNSSESAALIPKEIYDTDSYDGLDVELTFWSTDSTEPYGLWGPGATLIQGEPEIEVTDKERASASIDGYYETKIWPGLEVASFIAHEGEHTHEGFQTTYLLVTTREDIYTYRGIHIGSTLEALVAAYPDLCNDMDEWSAAYRASDAKGELMYTPKRYQGSLAPGLYFTVEDDVVSKMELRYLPQRNEF